VTVPTRLPYLYQPPILALCVKLIIYLLVLRLKMGAVPPSSHTLPWCGLELSYGTTYLYLHMVFPTDIEDLSLSDITLQPLEHYS